MILRKFKPPRLDSKSDEPYKHWIRTQACVVCRLYGIVRRQFGPVEHAHIGGRGLGQKCDDRISLPLCQWHHRLGPQSYHASVKRFWIHWHLDRSQLVAEYNRKFEEEKRNAA